MILAVDLGKTSCRAAAAGRRAEGAGAPGLATPGGVLIAGGKAYGPRMVDVRPTSAKLRRRAVRIVRDAAGVDEEAAAAALAAAGGHATTAIVALLAGVDVAEAAVRLDRARGRVWDALAGT